MKPLTQFEISQSLTMLPGWRSEDNELIKEFIFLSFREAMTFLIRVGFEAEELKHHPKIINRYSKVTLFLTTHDAGDKVTNNDIELALRIEQINK
ncbi:4a-hydroxytetrahydrobiopterin dehydratase [Candidatus Woesearchaeota archaeon]|nr:4a-hydroxytetrahydrobiopterin dehydratase [Candidatus Woesearchaeota archaeon]